MTKRLGPEDFEDEPPLFKREHRQLLGVTFSPDGVVTISSPRLREPPVFDAKASIGGALAPDRKSRETYRAAVAAYLQARPNQWVSGLELAKVGGAYAWRTRVSDARLQLGLNIENRQRKEGDVTVSEYRVVVP